MSYCRFAWDGSDVYVFHSSAGFECCGCQLNQEHGKLIAFEKPEEIITHLAAHRRANQFVPRYAIEGLWEEIEGAKEPVTPEPAEMTELKRKTNSLLEQG